MAGSIAMYMTPSQARPPAKGSFPLDREKECLSVEQEYLACLTRKEKRREQLRRFSSAAATAAATAVPLTASANGNRPSSRRSTSEASTGGEEASTGRGEAAARRETGAARREEETSAVASSRIQASEVEEALSGVIGAEVGETETVSVSGKGGGSVGGGEFAVGRRGDEEEATKEKGRESGRRERVVEQLFKGDDDRRREEEATEKKKKKNITAAMSIHKYTTDEDVIHAAADTPWDHLPCRPLAQLYLQCRMDKQLMTKENMRHLGFRTPYIAPQEEHTPHTSPALVSRLSSHSFNSNSDHLSSPTEISKHNNSSNTKRSNSRSYSDDISHTDATRHSDKEIHTGKHFSRRSSGDIYHDNTAVAYNNATGSSADAALHSPAALHSAVRAAAASSTGVVEEEACIHSTSVLTIGRFLMNRKKEGCGMKEEKQQQQQQTTSAVTRAAITRAGEASRRYRSEEEERKQSYTMSKTAEQSLLLREEMLPNSQVQTNQQQQQQWEEIPQQQQDNNKKKQQQQQNGRYEEQLQQQGDRQQHQHKEKEKQQQQEQQQEWREDQEYECQRAVETSIDKQDEAWEKMKKADSSTEETRKRRILRKEDTGYIAGISALRPYSERGFFGRIMSRYGWTRGWLNTYLGRKTLLPSFTKNSERTASEGSKQQPP